MSDHVVTVTLNPAIDLTVSVAGLKPGAVNRARAAQSNAGGKGINVAGCLADWGVPVIGTGLLGRGNESAFTAFFRHKGIEDRFVRAPGETRTNIKIADTETGETTDLNLPGLTADAGLLQAVETVLEETVLPGTLVVVAGSLPAGLPARATADLVARLNAFGARVVLDCSGPALAAALLAEPQDLPAVIKPNRAELEAFAGRPLRSTDDVTAVARSLVRRGIGLVAVSLGAEGALFVTAAGVLAARLPPVPALSTVGAGDAMVAGLVTALRETLDPDALARRAVAFAAAKLGGIGPNLPPRADVGALEAAAAVSGPADIRLGLSA
ncbi:1-phosphofructokinase [Pseudoxanthobacter sp.]|uniref:1-phosphofructokinase n=1 Tax=Pseudoxanthobacter sp. TaxID=1925742 RepID=UPI002FE39D39